MDDGRRVATGRAQHDDGIRAPETWWDSLAAALADATASGATYDAISITAPLRGLVALGADRRPVTAALAADDPSSEPDAGWLVKQLGGTAAWIDACGSVPTGADTIAKLSYLHRSDPEAFARLAHVLVAHDWLTFRLTGDLVTDRGDASGTGYWSPSEEAWRLDLLAIVDAGRDWASALPAVLGPADQRRTGRVVVAPGTGELMARSLALSLEPGDVAFVGAAAMAVTDRPVIDRNSRLAARADASGRYLAVAADDDAAEAHAVLRAAGVPVSGRVVVAGDTTSGKTAAVALGRPVLVVPVAGLAVRGACIGAAAALLGQPPPTVAARWAGAADEVVTVEP